MASYRDFQLVGYGIGIGAGTTFTLTNSRARNASRLSFRLGLSAIAAGARGLLRATPGLLRFSTRAVPIIGTLLLIDDGVRKVTRGRVFLVPRNRSEAQGGTRKTGRVIGPGTFFKEPNTILLEGKGMSAIRRQGSRQGSGRGGGGGF